MSRVAPPKPETLPHDARTPDVEGTGQTETMEAPPPDTPLEDYALLSNCRSAALVSREGSVDWLCLPRFDAPSLFAALLDRRAGRWRIGPIGPFETERRYLDGSLMLETTFRTDDGTVRVTDALAVGPREEGRDLGSGASPILMRRLECTGGTVRVRVDFEPRPEYGLIHPLLEEDDGAVTGQGGPSVLLLSIPEEVQMTLRESSAHAEIAMSEGQRLAFALEHRSSSEAPPERISQEEIHRLWEESLQSWREWAEAHEPYEGPGAELVHTSGCVLQGLTYQPTGAMVAAPTTSLATEVGGSRNWDYRYTWLRDSSFTLQAFHVMASRPEAKALFGFLAKTALSQVRRQGHVQSVYGIGGEHDLTERRLPHLTGWRGSAPVRIGNAAWQQRQLDVYGELIGAAYQSRDELEDAGPLVRRFLVRLVDAAANQWCNKDHGIWEMRTPPAHYVHSKLMCWVALDRALRMVDLLEASDRADDWRRERERIRDAILDHGWSDELKAFRQSFERDTLDASVLMIPIVGFLEAGDSRVIDTLEAIEDGLTDDHGLVYRYLADDGLEGGEGTFLLCTFWLAEAWARAGRVRRATDLFELAASQANDVGLLSEQVDLKSGRLLGNFPQAFSHIGLVNAAHALANAEATRPTP